MYFSVWYQVLTIYNLATVVKKTLWVKILSCVKPHFNTIEVPYILRTKAAAFLLLLSQGTVHKGYMDSIFTTAEYIE